MLEKVSFAGTIVLGYVLGMWIGGDESVSRNKLLVAGLLCWLIPAAIGVWRELRKEFP